MAITALHHFLVVFCFVSACFCTVSSSNTVGIFPGSFFTWYSNPTRFERFEAFLGRPIGWTTMMLDRGLNDAGTAPALSASVLAEPGRFMKFGDRVGIIVTVPIAWAIPWKANPDPAQGAIALNRTANGEWDGHFERVREYAKAGN